MGIAHEALKSVLPMIIRFLIFFTDMPYRDLPIPCLYITGFHLGGSHGPVLLRNDWALREDEPMLIVRLYIKKTPSASV